MAPPANPRKRPIQTENSASATITKKQNTGRPIKREDFDVPRGKHDDDDGIHDNDGNIKERFISLFSETQYEDGIANAQLKEIFGPQGLAELVPVINELLAASRLVMSKIDGKDNKDIIYKLVPEEIASKFVGLDPSAKLVYQSIQKAAVNGAWTKDIRRETNIQLQALNKIFKTLEARKLIKQVKSVNAKAKKLYMLYELQPSTELTGGVWYSDLEFDHEFINELRGFLMQCLRRLHNGQGCTIAEILTSLEKASVSRVKLNEENVQQLMSTLLFDNLVDETETDDGKIIYTASRRVTTCCDFKWWSDALAPDFHFRFIRFEDGVVLAPHEPHYHTA